MASTSSSQPDATFVCKHCKTEICEAVQIVNMIGKKDYEKGPELNLVVADGATENGECTKIELSCPGCGFPLGNKMIREWQGDALVEKDGKPRLDMREVRLKIEGVLFKNDLNPVND